MFKVGDLIKTTAQRSVFNSKLPVGAVYKVDRIEDRAATDYCSFKGVALWARPVGDDEAEFALDPATCSAYTLETPKPRNSNGWTFRATPADFDGPRILRELEAQGAQYAVIVWGKGPDDRIAVISQALDQRCDVYAKANSSYPDKLWTSVEPVLTFGPGKETTYGKEGAHGWHDVERLNGTPCKLSDLKALVKRVEAWEAANAKARVYVAYGASATSKGKVGDK